MPSTDGYATGVVLHDRPPAGLLEDLPQEWREALSGPETAEGLTADALGKLALIERLRLSVLEDLGRAERLSGGTAKSGAVLIGDDGRPTDARHLVRELTGSPALAAREVRNAHGLVHLPAVRAAVRDGLLTLASAEVIAQHAVPLIEAHLPARDVPAALAAADTHLVRSARSSVDPGGLRTLVKDWLYAHYPDAAEREADAARQTTVVRHRPLGDGLFRTTVDTDAPGHELLRAALAGADTRPESTDRRSRGQREHDALLDILSHSLGCRETASPSRTVLITCPWDTWTDTGTGTSTSTGHAAGRWTGPLTREQLVALCCDATTRLVLLRPDGQVAALTSATRDIPHAMRLAALARDDGRCRRRGCRSRTALELHHITAVRDGGHTIITNLVHLCLRDHALWHQQRLTATDLDITWTPSNDPPVSV